MKRKIHGFIGFLLIISTPLYAQNIELRLYKDAASLGMGGVGVSTIGYGFSPIYNPAALGLMADYEIAPFFSLGISINPEMFSLLNQVSALVGGEKSVTGLDYDSVIGKAPTLGLNGPINFGYMGKGFGFWTTSSADLSLGFINNTNTNNILAQNGININDISINALALASDEAIKLLDSGRDPASIRAGLEEMFENILADSLLLEGLTDTEIQEKAIQLATEIQANPDALKELIPLAKLSATAEITANLAYGYRIPFAIFDDVSGLSLGATVRFSQRFKASSGDFASIETVANSFGDLNKSIYQAGSVSFDFGVALRLENWILGVAVRDAWSTGYNWVNFDGLGGLAYSQIPLSLDFGTSYRFYFNNNMIQKLVVYLEFADTLSPYTSWVNKLRVGSEVKLFNFLDLRVGMYKSFITGGIGMGWKWFRMDFAYYRENYFDFFTSDQFYMNFTVGLDNSPQRKARSIAKQQAQDKIQAQALDLVNNSLAGM